MQIKPSDLFGGPYDELADVLTQGENAARRDFYFCLHEAPIGEQIVCQNCDYHMLSKEYNAWHLAYSEEWDKQSEKTDRRVCRPYFTKDVGA